MAQIKKLQKGNVFTIDGVAHNVDDALIGRLYDHAKSLDSGDAAQFGKIIDALKNGENLSYDSVQNKLTGTVNWDLKNERQKRRVGKRLNSPGGLVADTQNAVGALKTFSPIAMYASATTPEKKAEKIKKNWSKGHALKYITDPDGTRRLANTVDNQMAKNLLNTIHEINDYGDDIEFSGYNGAGKDVYKAWLQARQGNSSTQELLKRMESGQLSDEDWMILNEVGITDGTVADPNADQKARFQKAGLDWKKHKNHFNIDDEGNINVTDAFRTAIGHSGNIWFNDEWKNVNPDFDFLKGRMLWNGRLYNEADAITEGHALQRQLGQEGGFFDLLKRGDRKAANDIMNFSTDLVARERYDSKGPYYSKWMHGQGPNFWYSSMVGSHTTDGLQDGQQLIRYYNGDRDQYGRLTGAKYAILDANGNLVSDNISEDKIKKIEGSKGASEVTLAQRIADDENYKGMVREDVGGGSDKGGFSLFTNPTTGEIILDMGSHAKGFKHIENGAIRLPEQMAKEIFAMDPKQQQNFWNLLNKDEDLRKRFLQSFSQIGRSRWGQFWTYGDSPLNFITQNVLNEDDLARLGLSANVKAELEAARKTNGRFARRDKLKVDDYVKQVQAHQYGGTIGKESIETMPKTQIARTDVAANAREVNEGQLNNADRWQIASITGDVAALVANMSAVGAPIAAGLGLAGTGAQLVSDIKRDGFQMRDLGALAVNLGLDAATLLPNAGMSSMAKIGRGLTKSAGLIKKVLMGVGAVRGVQGLTNIINGEGTLDDWKALSQGLLVGQRAIKSGRNLAATKYQPNNAKATPQTKEGIQKQYIEEFVAANKDKVQGTIKGMSAEGKVTNLSEAKIALKDVEGFSLPDKMASAKAAGSQVKGFFSSKWNPFSDQFVLNAENRVLSPETMSAIKTGNSVWRSNAAHELGYLNPAIHKQIYTAGMNLPRTFGFNDPYVGNWFFRAPVFTKNGMAQTPTATPTSSVVPAPIVYNNTYRAPYVVKAGNLSEVKPTSLPSPTPKPAYIAPGLTVEQVAVPKQVVPVVPTTSIVPVQPSVMPARQGFNPEMLQQMRSNPQFMSWLYNTFFGRSLPAGNQPQALPASSTKYMLPMPSGRDANGAIITPIPEGAQFSLFKKGGKVKKVCKAQPGVKLSTKYNFGSGYNPLMNYNLATGEYDPVLAQIQMNGIGENTKSAINATISDAKSDPLGYNSYKPQSIKLSDIVTSEPLGNVTSSTASQFTQGSDQKTPYNWKPLGFMTSELAMSIGSAIAGGNKAKKANAAMAEASKTFTPYENGMIYSDQHVGRSEDAAYKALDDQTPLVSNDPSLQRAYELAKAKERVNIANNANAQRSALITAWNQEEAQRSYRNRVRGAENQQSARKAEFEKIAKDAMIDAGTLQSVTNSLMGGVRELRKEDLYRTADKNAQHAQNAQTQALAQMQASVGNKYKSEMERDPEFRSKYNGDVMEWFAAKHPGEYADLQTRFTKIAQNLYNNSKINTGILAKKGSKLRPTSDVMLIENQKHVNKSIRDLNNNLVKMFLKMMS